MLGVSRDSSRSMFGRSIARRVWRDDVRRLLRGRTAFRIDDHHMIESPTVCDPERRPGSAARPSGGAGPRLAWGEGGADHLMSVIGHVQPAVRFPRRVAFHLRSLVRNRRAKCAKKMPFVIYFFLGKKSPPPTPGGSPGGV